LLIAGADVESHITFLTLRALAEGFDVYLLSDLMASRDRQFTRIFQLRLFQAGAVPTTMTQFLLEWQTAESDTALTNRLQLLRDSFLLPS
jgi:nicotinamidase-related amidase